MMTNPKAQNIEIIISGLSVKIPVDRPLSELIDTIVAATTTDGATNIDQPQDAGKEEANGSSADVSRSEEVRGCDDDPDDDEPSEEEDDILDDLITSVAIERMLLFGEITPDEAIDLRHVLCSRLFGCGCDDD